MASNREIRIAPNKPFVWPKGQCLITLQDVTLVLPGGIVRENEPVGSIIEVSDEVEISFQESENQQNGFSFIILRLPRGESVRLNRSAQAMVTQPSGESIIFQVGY
jgi:hypothetical protein